MSNFRTTLRAIMEKNRINALRLSRASGISHSMISRIITGDKPRIDAEDLQRLSAAVTTDPQDRALLLAAHLNDERRGPAKDLVQIHIEERTFHETDIPVPSLEERAFRIIRNTIGDRRVRDIILGLANLIENGNASPDLPANPPGYAKPKKPKFL